MKSKVVLMTCDTYDETLIYEKLQKGIEMLEVCHSLQL